MSAAGSAPVGPWLLRFEPRPHASSRLLCVPYAGIGAAVYRPWLPLLPSDIELVAVELPGRGTRLREPPGDRLDPVVAALWAALEPLLDRPLAIFGHSMGALIGFELARELRRRGCPPQHLFASGRRAPRLPDRFSSVADLPDAEFVAEIQRRFDGIPLQVLHEPDLLHLMLPALRADVALLEHHVYRPEPPLELAITAFGGEEDGQVDPVELQAWQEETVGPFRLELFPGDHFFIQSARAEVVAAVVDSLVALVAPPTSTTIG
jgi:medium-chain acyl-[acyl-carrier-protein] hydrolase